MLHDKTVFLKCCNASKAHWSHMYNHHNQYLNVSVWNTEKREQRNGTLSKTTHLVMKKFLHIAAYNRTLIRRQSYYPYIFYWVAVTHVSAVFNPRCCNGSRWLFNFRRPSICQSSARPRVLRLFSLRCRFVASKFCFGLQGAWSNHLWIDFFFATPCPPLLQSKSTSVWVHHILRLSASAQEN